MYKKSPTKDKKDVSNEVISTENNIVSLVLKVLSEQQDSFSLFATSFALTLSHDSSSSSFTASPTSSDATNQTIIFSAPDTPQDSSILKMLDKFLKHIGFGEQDKAEEMLKKDNYLTLEAGDLTDCAKREFKQITAFQYSLWALDFHMWKMLLKYLPKEEASKQVIGLRNGDWVQIHGHHADWQNLIDSLQTYIDHYNLWSHEQLSDYWCQQVGGTQLLLPAHVINEYNHPLRSFYPAPANIDYDFILPRTGIDRWFTQGTRQLGKDFAWGRGGCDQAVAGLIGGDRWGARFGLLRDELPDLDAMRTILAYRKQQTRMLILYLSQHLSSHKPHKHKRL
jgi:hypothetical protein